MKPILFLMIVLVWVAPAGFSAGPAIDPINATYVIEDQEIRLIDGRFEAEAAPGSATKIRTHVFGKPALGDLNGDVDQDAALILVHDPGGSGTFYYVAAAVNVNGRYRGTRSVLIGDRITVRELAVRNGVIVVNYVDRRPEEPMATSPSVNKSKRLILKDDELMEICP